MTNWLVNWSFVLFAVLFSISIINTVRFIIPFALPLLTKPEIYYSDYREKYEKSIDDKVVLEDLPKASYIHELEKKLIYIDDRFARKFIFYSNGINYALLALIPYLICFWQHISIGQAIKVQGAELTCVKQL